MFHKIPSKVKFDTFHKKQTTLYLRSRLEVEENNEQKTRARNPLISCVECEGAKQLLESSTGF